MRPHGRARVSARSPRAFGICDRCGFLYNHDQLRWQFDWAGAGLINKRILVCRTCEDKPQNQLRAIVVPADPVPIQNPRTQDYVTAETDYRQSQIGISDVPNWINNSIQNVPWLNNSGISISWIGVYNQFSVTTTINYPTGIPVPNGETRITQNNDNRVVQQTGEPPYGLNQIPGVDWNVPPGPDGVGVPYDNNSVPYTGPLPPFNNYTIVWGNDVLWGTYWGNNQGAGVGWSSTIL